MIRAIKQILSDADGRLSSKRVIMFFFAVLFAYAVISEQWSGKHIDEIMKWQLFGLLIWLISVVFGEKLPDIFTAWFGKKIEKK